MPDTSSDEEGPRTNGGWLGLREQSAAAVNRSARSSGLTRRASRASRVAVLDWLVHTSGVLQVVTR